MDIFSFYGRANRADFWLVSVGLTFLQLIFSLLTRLIIGMLAGDTLAPEHKTIATLAFGLVLNLLFLWPITAVAVRRSHDRNMSGWWYGAFALFGVGLVAVSFALDLLAIPQGEGETMIFEAAGLAQVAGWLVFLVILGFLPGTRGANRIGPAPNSRQENYRAPPVL
jgi:uncharacterized membrane protein YhaH (DUF805 family)